MKATFKSHCASALLFSILSFLLSISGCSLFDSVSENSSVLSFTISGEMASRITAASRAAEDSATENNLPENLFLEIAIKGDFSQTRTVPVSEGAKLVFENISAGSSLWAEAEAFASETSESGESERVNLFAGKTDVFVMHEGENFISLKMKRVGKLKAKMSGITQENSTITKATDEDSSDGKIENSEITTEMEYSVDDGKTWQDVTVAGEISGLKAGTVLIRMKETEKKAASVSVSIIVPVLDSLTVLFISGDEILSSQSVKRGYTVERPEDPEKDGYDFNGWFTDPGCNYEFDFSETVTGELKLYAGWITHSVSGTPYVEYSFDVDKKQLSSQLKGAADYVELGSDGPVEWEDGKYYLVNGEVTIVSRITIAANSTVYLILGDGATLNVNGITLDASGKNLVIYGQSESSGVLNAVSSSYSGIGGTGAGKGTITVHGGTVNAKATSSAAGIGAAGNNGCFDGTVTLYNGTINATGDGWGAGIGGTRNAWGQSGEVIVYGGSLTATGGTQGAGIGGGEGRPGGTLKVYGGYVKAIGGAGGPFSTDGYAGSPAGIGGGGSYDYNSEQNSPGGTVEIYGGTVEAYGLRGIGAGGSYGFDSAENPQGTLTIEDGLLYKIIAGGSESTASATSLEVYKTDRNSYVKIVVQ
ncbi:MAG: InlB B-repeat-containing protein [Treponema sp.]|nr:InlB B-repeat-containing protein [Treponema sp.]